SCALQPSPVYHVLPPSPTRRSSDLVQHPGAGRNRRTDPGARAARLPLSGERAGVEPAPAQARTGGGAVPAAELPHGVAGGLPGPDRKSTRLNSSHVKISYAVFCLKK